MKTLMTYGPGVFPDEEFEKAAKELAEPDLVGWEFFVESHGTKIFRKYKEVGWRLAGPWCSQLYTETERKDVDRRWTKWVGRLSMRVCQAQVGLSRSDWWFNELNPLHLLSPLCCTKRLALQATVVPLPQPYN